MSPSSARYRHNPNVHPRLIETLPPHLAPNVECFATLLKARLWAHCTQVVHAYAIVAAAYQGTDNKSFRKEGRHCGRLILSSLTIYLPLAPPLLAWMLLQPEQKIPHGMRFIAASLNETRHLMCRDIKMGQLPRQWNDKANSITFCVTEDCNLACKYCYMTGKNSKNKMPFAVATKAVDYILADKEHFKEDAVVWEFIGGEPFLEIDLVDRISDYIKQQMFLLGHRWFDAYRFNFSTNGLLYHTSKVQKYIWKNQGHVSIGISIDGNKTKHDLQRVRKDGSGSFDAVTKNVPLWLSQMPHAVTKSTFSHDDLPHLKDSIIALWDMGITTVAANVVFEDVWSEDDDLIFESQLKELADYVIDNELYYDYSVRFFDPKVGNPLTEDDLEVNYCGAGRMLAIDCQGNFYPCIRFYDISLSHKKGLRIGDIHSGINSDRLRPFYALTLRTQSRDECINCEVGKGCSWCNGCNYDCADSDTIFQRATFICKMHKANARANEYFWKRLSDVTGRISAKEELRLQGARRGVGPARYLYIMTRDDIAPHCHYRNVAHTSANMEASVLTKSLAFCKEAGFIPVFLGTPPVGTARDGCLSITGADDAGAPKGAILVFDNRVDQTRPTNGNCILLIDQEHLATLCELVESLLRSSSRVNVILEGIESWNDNCLRLYERELVKVAEAVRLSYERGRLIEINVLTDLWSLTGMCNCDAGERSFVVAPNGRIYLCPAFYYDSPEQDVGTLETGINVKSPRLLRCDSSLYCNSCDVFSCRRCKFLNRRLTGEINIPSRMQCLVGHVEREISMKLQSELLVLGLLTPRNVLRPVSYRDPLELFA